MSLPRKLSVNPNSPNYDRRALERVDRVKVDGVHLPLCGGYDKDAGWAFAIHNGVWQPKVYGKVTVSEKGRIP